MSFALQYGIFSLSFGEKNWHAVDYDDAFLVYLYNGTVCP